VALFLFKERKRCMPNKSNTGRAKCVMEKHFLGFLDGGDPERGSVGGVPPEFLQHAFCLPTEQNF